MKVIKLKISLSENNSAGICGSDLFQYMAEAIEDDGRYYYCSNNVKLEITQLEYSSVIGNPSLYYFSTALKLHKLIEKRLARQIKIRHPAAVDEIAAFMLGIPAEIASETNPSAAKIKKDSCGAILPPQAEPLEALLSMPLKDRVAAVAQDVRSREDKFAKIDPFKLADALGVPEAENPGGDWWFIHYAERVSVEEYARCVLPVSELVYLLKDHVNSQRFEVLANEFALLDGKKKPHFGFLAANERESLEEAIARKELSRNMDNGIRCVAHYKVEHPEVTLRFEAEIEDDGVCIHLKTPYGGRDGHFVKLDNCVTDEHS